MTVNENQSLYSNELQNYYPFGMAAEAAEQGALTDTYAVISIQDSHTGGFGVTFDEYYFSIDPL